MQLLNTNDANSVFAGLHCMLAICRMYRFKGGENRGHFNQIVEASFPQLLGIATRLGEERSMEAWEMLHIIMKAYKHAIYVGLPSVNLNSRLANIHIVRTTWIPNASRSNGRLVYLIFDYRWQRGPSPRSR